MHKGRGGKPLGTSIPETGCCSPVLPAPVGMAVAYGHCLTYVVMLPFAESISVRTLSSN